MVKPAAIRPQYHGRHTPEGFYVWDVRALIQRAAELPIIEVRLTDIRELDETYWYDEGSARPTAREIAEHMRLVQECELKFPILLCSQGRLMDGMHRVVRAYLEGHNLIQAKRFKITPPPDHIDIKLDDLPYEE